MVCGDYNGGDAVHSDGDYSRDDEDEEGYEYDNKLCGISYQAQATTAHARGTCMMW